MDVTENQPPRIVLLSVRKVGKHMPPLVRSNFFGPRVLVTLIVLSGNLFSFAQATDAAQKVSDALTGFGPVPITIVTQVPRVTTVCHSEDVPGTDRRRIVCGNRTVYDPVTKTSNQILTAANIRVVKADQLVFGEMTRHDLPDRLTVDDFLAQNCTPDPATPSFSVSTSFQRSASLAFQQSITHTVTYGVNVTAKLTDVWSVGGNISLGKVLRRAP
jgi:hypothetical protein